MSYPNTSVLALLYTCKLTYDELLVFIFSTKFSCYDRNDPRLEQGFRKLNPIAKAQMTTLIVAAVHGFIDLAPIWLSLHTECPSPLQLGLTFRANDEEKGISTVLDLAVKLNEAKQQSAPSFKLMLLCPHDEHQAGGHLESSKSRLQHLQKEALERHTIYKMSLPSSIQRIHVNIEEPPRSRLSEAITVLKFDGPRAFVRRPRYETGEVWTWRFRTTKHGKEK